MRSPEVAPAEPLQGKGESPDGKARAVVVTPGRVESLHVEPRLLRQGSENVCVAIMSAVNAALADLQTQAQAIGPDIDPTGLADELERIQEESFDSARSMLSVLQGVMDRFERPG
jgi:hypothetical protein